MVTVLAIDGGGIRGIIPANILAELEKRTGKSISSMFDYISGTSTGGILAALLSIPGDNGNPKYTAEQARDLYTEFGSRVFRRGFFRKVGTLSGLVGNKYSEVPLERLLREYLGYARLGGTLTNIIIPAYETETARPWFFKSSYSKNYKFGIRNPLLENVVRATSAAPSYFRPVCFDGYTFVDGGIFANNPAMCAFADARRDHPGEKIFVVSIGTGVLNRKHVYKKIKSWGIAEWAVPLVGIVQNSASATVDYHVQTISEADYYHRIQVHLDESCDKMDDAKPENIRRLEALSRAEIKQRDEQLTEISAALREHKVK